MTLSPFTMVVFMSHDLVLMSYKLCLKCSKTVYQVRIHVATLCWAIDGLVAATGSRAEVPYGAPPTGSNNKSTTYTFRVTTNLGSVFANFGFYSISQFSQFRWRYIRYYCGPFLQNDLVPSRRCKGCAHNFVLSLAHKTGNPVSAPPLPYQISFV